jgi:hypothetical protein
VALTVTGRQNDGCADTANLYAWLSRDQDGVEGIVAMPAPDGCAVPLIMADLDRALGVQRLAELAAAARGFPARLVRFERREEITVTGINQWTADRDDDHGYFGTSGA